MNRKLAAAVEASHENGGGPRLWHEMKRQRSYQYSVLRNSYNYSFNMHLLTDNALPNQGISQPCGYRNMLARRIITVILSPM